MDMLVALCGGDGGGGGCVVILIAACSDKMQSVRHTSDTVTLNNRPSSRLYQPNYLPTYNYANTSTVLSDCDRRRFTDAAECEDVVCLASL